MDWDVSVLGLEIMSLPVKGDGDENLRGTESFQMIRYALDHGVNLLHLDYPLHRKQHGGLIRRVREALQDGYRDGAKVALTVPSNQIHSSQDLDRFIKEKLQLLHLEAIDFLVFGELNRIEWSKLQDLNALGWAEWAMKEGRINHLGFSFHDDFQVLKDILDGYPHWTLCQFRYSYMDVAHHPGLSGLQYAHKKGLAVVVREPLRRGRLTREPPGPVAEVWKRAKQKRSLAEWGLRWIWNHPEVSVAVTDMSSMEQVVEYVALADRAEPDSLSVLDLVLINQVRETYNQIRPIPCTACGCCMPCPQEIDVPQIFELYNDAVLYGEIDIPRFQYELEQHDLGHCTECGSCAEACPKEIAILDFLKAAHQCFENEDP